MSRQRNLIILLVALFMGAIAVYLANSYLAGVETRNAQLAQEFKLNSVVTSRVAMNYGDQITADKLDVVPWPASSVPQGAFSDIRALTSDPSGPRVVLRPIAAGEPVLSSMLTGPGGRAVISAVLPKDKRAVSIRVNDVAGVAGFVLPGDSVDVLLTRELPSTRNMRVDQVTDTIVENVRVIAADQNANDASNDPKVSKTVTLEVDPEQAQKLALAGQVGTLSLALRNAANQKPADLKTTKIADLGPDSASEGPQTQRRRRIARAIRKAPPKPQVIVGRGVKLSKVEVME